MSPDFEFLIEMIIAICGAGVVFYFMEKAQKRKEDHARREFELTMKARGLSLEIIETKGDKSGTETKKR